MSDVEVLDMRQAAAILRCSPATVRARLRAGQIGGWKEPGSLGWRTTRADLNEYVNGQRVTGAGRIPARSTRSRAARKSASTRGGAR